MTAEPGTENGAGAAGQDSGENCLNIDSSLAPAEECGDQRAGKEKEKVDGSGFRVVHIQNCRKPQHQQTAASHAQTGKNTENGTDCDGKNMTA